MNRLEHLRRWQAEYERYRIVPVAATERMRWMWRQKSRLFRYLLATYGNGAWRPDDDDVSPAEAGATATTIPCDSPREGKPPKGLGQIRHALKSIHGACETPAQGPLTGGLFKRSWITVASFRSGKEPLFLESLKRHAIPCGLVKQGRTTLVQVRRTDSDQAFQLLEEMRREIAQRHRDNRFSIADEPVRETPPTEHAMRAALFACIWLMPTVAAIYLATLADNLLLGKIQLLPGGTGLRGVGLFLGLVVAGLLHTYVFSRLRRWRSGPNAKL
ncbi:MAG: hypothetical protein RIC55_03255 [Pirellulaceae bacterium]